MAYSTDFKQRALDYIKEGHSYVEAHPDAFLREIAAHFDCAVPSVWVALKQIKVTLKKDD